MRGRAITTAPEDGDVVICHHERDGRRMFALHTVPGPEQCVLRSRDDAIRHAVVFAKRAHVRVWSGDDGAGLILLKDFRVLRAV
jgi:hypothetical protein